MLKIIGNRKIKKSLAALTALVAVLLAGCSDSEGTDTDQSQDGVKVVATFYPVYEFAKKVVGEEGQVEMLLDAGQETHDFEASPQDLAMIAEADVFVYATPYMETWVSDVLAALEGSDVKIVEAGAGIALFEEEEETPATEDLGGEEKYVVDPHIWLDPVYAQDMVATISTAVQEADSEKAAAYKQNTEQYIQELIQLDQEYQETFGQATNRTFVVQHSAFGYLARRYNLEEVAISSLTGNQEVSPANIVEVGNYMNVSGIDVIYYQDSASSKVAETLAAETGATLDILYAIESIPQKEREQGFDYLTLMRKNLEALKKEFK